MPRELITVQVGQCGLQVGTKFWELALREHSAANRAGVFDDPLSSFFRNVDCRFHPSRELPVGDGSTPIATLKARAVLVDMEEGVLNELSRSPLADLFDLPGCSVKDVSGSGNNFAHGHFLYGPQYGPEILQAVRRAVEPCDSLQAFFFMHSLGGGTGSGLGTYVLGLLADEYPEVYRFTTGVFPSDQDDVVTSPYNSVLSLAQLVEHADAVLPVHNQALMDIVARMNRPVPGQRTEDQHKASLVDPTGSAAASAAGSASAAAARKKQRSRAFDDMNTLTAQLLTSLTCSMRFEGELNVDLNEITMNLVPFPRMHFLLSSLAPLGGGKYAASAAAAASAAVDSRVPVYSASASSSVGSKSIDAMFSALFQAESHLVKVNPKHSGVYLACGIFARGDVSVSDLNRNIARLKGGLNMVGWNEDGFKIGLCSVPPVGLRHSLLSLSNSSCIADLISDLGDRHAKLYSRKAHFHHYLEYMEQDDMDRAVRHVDSVVQDYAKLERRDMEQREEQANGGSTNKPRMKPMA